MATRNLESVDLRLWAAYLIGYGHGIEAMRTAVPIGDAPAFGLRNLLSELDRQERRDDI